MALLLLILKVALIAFLAGGVVVLIARGVRRSRANRSNPQWRGGRTQPGYEASINGAMPNTPLPEWAYWPDEDQDDGRATRN
ncbi:hypothetical protein U8D42_19770 [Mycobacterium europaeum]|uniref:hypothetical protein n=1 Tax=Mycobacterium europaeum TaxID=761804 RepID=UPI002ADF85C6|nr:hypothetical protein [Mycobacterium europaeum]MEA1158410.1 hypothetical protein [Mycobacterium europaeum]